MKTKFKRSARFKSWAKVVTKVDTTKQTGYAFDGYFVRTNQLVEVPDDCVIITYEELGSVKNRTYEVVLYRVANGELEEVETVHGRDWALKIRDKVAEMVPQAETSPAEVSTPQPEMKSLASYTSQELLAELRRRAEEAKENE